MKDCFSTVLFHRDECMTLSLEILHRVSNNSKRVKHEVMKNVFSTVWFQDLSLYYFLYSSRIGFQTLVISEKEVSWKMVSSQWCFTEMTIWQIHYISRPSFSNSPEWNMIVFQRWFPQSAVSEKSIQNFLLITQKSYWTFLT